LRRPKPNAFLTLQNYNRLISLHHVKKQSLPKNTLTPPKNMLIKGNKLNFFVVSLFPVYDRYIVEMEDFAAKMLADLHRFLLERGAVDERWPECPDVEEKWPAIAEAYLPDGAREFANYPVASLGWMMFVAMALTKFWDVDWEKYSQEEKLYEQLRDKRGYDNLDEYILDEVLDVHGDAAEQMQNLVGDCAERVKRALYRLDIEPGTADAFRAYVACLQCMYQTGIAVQLKAMGYHMTKLN